MSCLTADPMTFNYSTFLALMVGMAVGFVLAALSGGDS
jgi:hypothetical protein